MAHKSLFVGVDIGTTSTKAVVFDAAGAVLGHHTAGYALHTPAPLIAEQDPDEIFAATLTAIGRAVAAADAGPGRIAAVSFSAAMHSLIAVDGDGRPLTASITWADNRAADSADRSAASSTAGRSTCGPAPRSTRCRRWPSCSGCASSGRSCLLARRASSASRSMSSTSCSAATSLTTRSPRRPGCSTCSV